MMSNLFALLGVNNKISVELKKTNITEQREWLI